MQTLNRTVTLFGVTKELDGYDIAFMIVVALFVIAIVLFILRKPIRRLLWKRVKKSKNTVELSTYGFVVPTLVYDESSSKQRIKELESEVSRLQDELDESHARIANFGKEEQEELKSVEYQILSDFVADHGELFTNWLCKRMLDADGVKQREEPNPVY